jgi:hypothetical protein
MSSSADRGHRRELPGAPRRLARPRHQGLWEYVLVLEDSDARKAGLHVAIGFSRTRQSPAVVRCLPRLPHDEECEPMCRA